MEPKESDHPSDFEVVRTDATLIAIKASTWDAYEETFAILFETAGRDDIFLGFRSEVLEELIGRLQQAVQIRRATSGHA